MEWTVCGTNVVTKYFHLGSTGSYLKILVESDVLFETLARQFLAWLPEGGMTTPPSGEAESGSNAMNEIRLHGHSEFDIMFRLRMAGYTVEEVYGIAL